MKVTTVLAKKRGPQVKTTLLSAVIVPLFPNFVKRGQARFNVVIILVSKGRTLVFNYTGSKAVVEFPSTLTTKMTALVPPFKMWKAPAALSPLSLHAWTLARQKHPLT